jgi:3D (Asp-Asp-Asp) domain-containing protein
MKIQNILFLVCSLFLVSCQNIKKNTVDIATTAYTSKERDHIKYGVKNASGTTLKVGQIAADWSVFPVDTVLKINGNNYTVTDYGSALVDKERDGRPIVDIYCPTRKQMNKWGVRYFDDVQVVRWGSIEKSLTILESRLKYRHCRSMWQKIKKRQ